MTGAALNGCAPEAEVLAEGFKAMVTSPSKPLGEGGNEHGINNSAVTPSESLRAPGPIASVSTEPADGAGRAGLPPQESDLRITDFLVGKCYLVTGITGFMGTVLAEKILREAPAGTKIYVPIRNAPRMSFVDRFWKKVLPRDFFNLLREQKGDGFEAFIREHVIPFEADMDKPLLGIAPDMLAELHEKVEVVVHCAANTGFHVPLDEILHTNTIGFVELLKVAAGCKRLKVCSTVSTAYVHGGRPGVLPETAVAAAEPPSLWHPLEPAQTGKAPSPAAAVTANGSLTNGHADHHSNGDAQPPVRRESVPGVYLDLESELTHAQEAVARASQEAAASGLTGKDLAKHDRKLRIAVGKIWLPDYCSTAPRRFGWHDSYTYSKALAELAAVRAAEEHGMPMLILRPTIVESAMREPAPGIIDSIACMEPLVFGYGRGAMDGFPMDPELPLDIVPVDTSINAILAALAATAGRSGVHVFQIGSSHCNPLLLKNLVRTLWDYLCKHPMRDDMYGDIVKMTKYPVFYPDVPSFIASLKKRHDSLLEGVDTNEPEGAALKDGLARALKFTQYLAEIYHPYTRYGGLFRADNLTALWERISPDERQRYPFALHQINWEDYLFNTHFPGIRKYLLDEEEEDWAFNNDSTLTVGRNY